MKQLTAMERVELIERLDEERRERLLRDLEGVDDTTRVQELRFFEASRGDPGTLLAFCGTVAGATELQERGGREPTLDLEGVQFAARMVGMDWAIEVDESSDPTQSPNPTPGGG